MHAFTSYGMQIRAHMMWMDTFAYHMLVSHANTCLCTVVVVVACGRLTVPSFGWSLMLLPGTEFSCSWTRVQSRRLCVVFHPVHVVAPCASGSPSGRQYSPEALSGRRTTDSPVCVCELRYPSLDPVRLFTLEICTGSGPPDLAKVKFTLADWVFCLCLGLWLPLWEPRSLFSCCHRTAKTNAGLDICFLWN